MSGDDSSTIHSLATFKIGELPGGYLALLLAYATSQEKLASGEMESVVIGLDRELATELGEALIRESKKPASGAAPPSWQ